RWRWYQARSATGSCAWKKMPPMPVTRCLCFPLDRPSTFGEVLVHEGFDCQFSRLFQAGIESHPVLHLLGQLALDAPDRAAHLHHVGLAGDLEAKCKLDHHTLIAQHETGRDRTA